MRLATSVEASDTFRTAPGYTSQYTSVYYARLAQLRPHVVAPAAWADARAVSRVLDVRPNELAWIVGTITREVAHKPNIMQDLKRLYHGEQPRHAETYAGPDDKVHLEDDYGRIRLVGVPPGELLVTGLVVAVLGSQNAVGEFEVGDLSYPRYNDAKSELEEKEVLEEKDPRREGGEQNGEGEQIAFISGLLLDGSPEPRLDLVLDFLATNPRVSRLVIAGDSLRPEPEELVGARVLRAPTRLDRLATFDRLLAALAMLLPVHVMPGAYDPTTIAFPQTPIHPAVLRSARALLDSAALQLDSNPQHYAIAGGQAPRRTLLGTSGQPVHDLLRYAPGDDMGMLRHTLRWRHLAPTAPDTLASYPYTLSDPLVLDERPDVLFAGNCAAFATEECDGVRLLCVPRFRETGEVVLLDLASFDVEVVAFE